MLGFGVKVYNLLLFKYPQHTLNQYWYLLTWTLYNPWVIYHVYIYYIYLHSRTGGSERCFTFSSYWFYKYIGWSVSDPFLVYFIKLIHERYSLFTVSLYRGNINRIRVFGVLGVVNKTSILLTGSFPFTEFSWEVDRSLSTLQSQVHRSNHRKGKVLKKKPKGIDIEKKYL